jgi:type III restriction enzyme
VFKGIAEFAGSKPWRYLLLPHDEIGEAKRLGDLLRFEIKAKHAV